MKFTDDKIVTTWPNRISDKCRLQTDKRCNRTGDSEHTISCAVRFLIHYTRTIRFLFFFVIVETLYLIRAWPDSYGPVKLITSNTLACFRTVFRIRAIIDVRRRFRAQTITDELWNVCPNRAVWTDRRFRYYRSNVVFLKCTTRQQRVSRSKLGHFTRKTYTEIKTIINVHRRHDNILLCRTREILARVHRIDTHEPDKTIRSVSPWRRKTHSSRSHDSAGKTNGKPPNGSFDGNICWQFFSLRAGS